MWNTTTLPVDKPASRNLKKSLNFTQSLNLVEKFPNFTFDRGKEPEIEHFHHMLGMRRVMPS